MKNIFENTSASWLCYDSYRYREAADGTLYIVVSDGAKPKFYYPLRDSENIVTDAICAGWVILQNPDSDEARDVVLEFVNTYGFLGLMTALPTTVNFIEYEAVYLPKNHFIKEEMLPTEEYLDFFYPFEKLDLTKEGKNSLLNINDRTGIQIALTMGDDPQTVTMSFQKEYAERYEWIARELADWAYTVYTSFIYYKEKDSFTDEQKYIIHKGLSAFGAISPTYRVALGEDRPKIIWDFYSLAVILQLSISVKLSDPDLELCMCKNCDRFFFTKRKGVEFCSPKCRNRYNVSKSRNKER